MLAVQDKETKFLLEVLSSLDSSLEEVISPSLVIMSDQFERQNVLVFVMDQLRKAVFNSKFVWLLRSFYHPKQAIAAEEIISNNTREFPQHIELPDNFLEVFKRLPDVPMKNMLCHLSWKDIYNLQLVAGPFSPYLQNGRRNYPINNLVQGVVQLDGTETVTVVRFQTRLIIINHEQFSRSLRSVHLRTLLIKQNGTLRAASFHIPELQCRKLELRIRDLIDEDPEAEDELVQLLEQIIVNPYIASLTLIARKNTNPEELSDRLNGIVEHAPHLNRELTKISIIPP